MNNKKKDFKFDKRAANYDGFEGKAAYRFYNLLLKQIKLFPGASVLDVGCGTGTVLRRMADVCNINGYGIDIEENMIAEAKTKCPEMNIFVSKCEDTPFDDESFDIVVTCMAYHHFSDKEGFAKEASRLLKHDGILYIADPRFPWPIRKIINGIARLFRVSGEFFKPNEIFARFSGFGFEYLGFEYDGYAQVVKMKKL